MQKNVEPSLVNVRAGQVVHDFYEMHLAYQRPDGTYEFDDNTESHQSTLSVATSIELCLLSLKQLILSHSQV